MQSFGVLKSGHGPVNVPWGPGKRSRQLPLVLGRVQKEGPIVGRRSRSSGLEKSGKQRLARDGGGKACFGLAANLLPWHKRGTLLRRQEGWETAG